MVVALMAAQLLIGGIGVAVSYAVAGSGAPGRVVLRNQLGRWAGYGLVAGGAASGLTYVLLLESGHPSPTGLAAAAGVVATFSSWMQVLSAMLRGEGDVGGVSVIPMLATSTYVAGVILCFLFLPSADAVAVAGVYLASQVLGLGLAWRRLRKDGSAPAADRRSLGKMARRSWATAVNTLGLGFDQLVVSLLLGTHALGLYVVAASITNVPAMALRPVSAMLMPRIVAAPPEIASAMTRRWLAAAAGLDLLMVAGLEVVIGPVIRILFGSEFTSATTAARIMIIAWGFLAFRLVLTAVLQAQGRAGKASVVEVIATVALVTGSYFGAQHHGIEGVATAVAVAAALACLLAATQLRAKGSPSRPAG